MVTEVQVNLVDPCEDCFYFRDDECVKDIDDDILTCFVPKNFEHPIKRFMEKER